MRKLQRRQAGSMPTEDQARQAEQNLYSRLGNKRVGEATRIQQRGTTGQGRSVSVEVNDSGDRSRRNARFLTDRD